MSQKEEFKFNGSELVERIKELIHQGNVRKITIKKENGEVLFEIPVTAGVAVGGALTLFAPVLAAIGAAAALLTHVRVEVQRIDGHDD
ncbi:DUF4342 domain-containing protein [Spirochaeta lutea]|uniref:DUF4342 domain-containing protein n=1 Tax=Spirochaeta lutea TaxID=1480694 RepID=A0A098QVR8_9SPIO|nr:DUF4342 domain-containing protein [Spirochaeta lutea]KGE71930.1 hypothetical protein DC28_09030 [Spirochaeta lutea]